MCPVYTKLGEGAGVRADGTAGEVKSESKQAIHF
jgi:hypothetical protein